MTNKDTLTLLREVEAALKVAFSEFNAIRARDGAPQHIEWYQGRPLQTSSCTHEWWDEATNMVDASLPAIQELIRRASVVVDAEELNWEATKLDYAQPNSDVDLGNLYYWANLWHEKYKTAIRPHLAPVASVDDNYVVIRVGPHRKMLRNSMDDTYMLKVEKRGDVAVFTIRRKYPEGPFYKKPETFCFAVDCEPQPPQAKGAWDE